MRAKLPGFLQLLLVLLLLRPVFATDPLCLEPGIAEENRTFIEDDQGRGIPIGLLIYLRTSSKVLTRIAGILISEKLGFHIDYMYQKEHSREGAYWLSCADVNTSAVGAEQCVPGENRAHVALDTGFGPTPYEVGFLRPQRLLQDCCQRSPRDLGSMGFQSRENMYMKRSELEAALADGFILNLYSSYNTTHHDPRKYFEGLDSLNISHFEACNRTFSWTLSSEDLEGYVNWTGDFDGVTQAADGTYWLRCPDEYFWLAPACRHNVSSCIPTVTFGGELFLEMMHWSPCSTVFMVFHMHICFGFPNWVCDRCLGPWPLLPLKPSMPELDDQMSGKLENGKKVQRQGNRALSHSGRRLMAFRSPWAVTSTPTFSSRQ